MVPAITERSKKEPLLRTRFLSHGTLEIRDIAASRRFYEEVLGLEVVQQAPMALFVRLGGDHVYAAVETAGDHGDMPLLHHNGLDVGSDDEVDQSYQKILDVRDDYGIQQVTRPVRQHGAYSFYLKDRDGNWWEICHLPRGGYSFRFRNEEFDLTGRHHLSKGELLRVYQGAAAEFEAAGNPVT